MGTDATAGCAVWGDLYWPRFGARWLASIERADPKPDAVIVASDRWLDVPEWVNLIVSDEPGFMLWNRLAMSCDSTWICITGVDDEFVIDAFGDLDAEEDAIAFGCQQVGEASSIALPAGGDAYSVMWQLSNNPMNGGQFFRASALREVPFRDYVYADEVLWSEWSYFGKTVKFENRVRQIWHRWSGANSWPANHAAERDAQEFKRKLREGLIQKGMPE